MEFQVRRLERAEGPLLRRVRVEALQDSPEQFGEALANALVRTDDEWMDLAAFAYVAEAGEALLGMAFAFEDQTEASIGRLGGMWVAPTARRAGIGTALVAAVVSWARSTGKRCVRLWVVPSTAGEQLYRGAHFVLTGVQKAFPLDASRVVLEMELRLNDVG